MIYQGINSKDCRGSRRGRGASGLRSHQDHGTEATRELVRFLLATDYRLLATFELVCLTKTPKWR
jgi:hypothetical protein